MIPQFKRVIGNIPRIGICKIINFLTVSSLPISKNINLNCNIDADAEVFLLRSHFAEHSTGVLPLSKEDIKILAICLKRMLVLDPRNRAHSTRGLLGVHPSSRWHSFH